MLQIGRITGTFGLAGELKCDPSNAGRTLFFPGTLLHCAAPEFDRELRIAGLREHKGRLLIHFEGVDDAAQAQPFVGATLFAPKTAVEATLEADEYLDEDLTGCALQTSSGEQFGTVSAVLHYPASDMLIVNGRMVPMVKAFIKEIRLPEKRIIVDLPAGLLTD